MEKLAKWDTRRSGPSSQRCGQLCHDAIRVAVDAGRAREEPTPARDSLPSPYRALRRSASRSSTGSAAAGLVIRLPRRRPIAVCQSATTVGLAVTRTVRSAGERLGAVRGSRTVTRARPDGEAQRWLEDQGLPVDADLHRPGRAHLELGGRPLLPAGEAPDLARGFQRSKLLGLGCPIDPQRDDAKHAAVDALAGAPAAQVRQVVGVVGHEQQLARGRLLAGRQVCSAGRAASPPAPAGRAAWRPPSDTLASR